MALPLKVEIAIASGMTALGLCLLVYMIVVESEPGAIPLLLLLFGIGWLISTRFRRSP